MFGFIYPKNTANGTEGGIACSSEREAQKQEMRERRHMFIPARDLAAPNKIGNSR